jgi:hypothetical protein
LGNLGSYFSWENYKNFLFNSLGTPGTIEYYKKTTSFSGCDIKVLVQPSRRLDQDFSVYGSVYGGAAPIVLGELHTITYSTFREKGDVRAFGTSDVKGFVRGPRTYAGSMIFSVFNQHALSQLTSGASSGAAVLPHHESLDARRGVRQGPCLLDQLPLFDVTILFANELGNISRMGIYGIDISSEGQVMSIQDLNIENSVVYKASFVEPMTPVVQLASVLDDTDGSPEGAALKEALLAGEFIGGTAEKIKYYAELNLQYYRLLKKTPPSLVSTLPRLLGEDPEARQLLQQSRNPFR